jgi:non-ribosomal peptide synthase protein (TIGR01720 family)
VRGVDVSRTVGWFTSIYPVVLEKRSGEGRGERLKRVKEEMRATPNRGIGYGILRYLSPDEGVREEMRRLGEADVSFNYLGQWDQAMGSGTGWRVALERQGEGRSERGRRRHLIEINGMVRGGRLEVGWTYSRGRHLEETVRRVAERFIEELRGIIAHCREAGAGGYTPSDFQLAQLDAEKLNKLLEIVEEIDACHSAMQ